MYRSKWLFFISGYTLISAGKLAAREGLMALGGKELKSSLACWREVPSWSACTAVWKDNVD